MGLLRIGLIAGDAASVAAAMVLATTLQYGGAVPHDMWDALRLASPVAAIDLVVANYAFGLYNRVWRYAGAETAVAVVTSVSITFLVTGVAVRLMAIPVPALVWYTAGMAVLLWVGGVRLAGRLIRPSLMGASSKADGAHRRILIYGAGDNGYAVSRTLDSLAGHGQRVVGYLDDDLQKVGVAIGNARVLGTGDDLARVVAEVGATEVIIAIPPVGRDKLRSIYMACRDAGVRATRVPPLLEVIETPAASPRDVQVEDLLRRNIGESGIELHADYIRDKTVLVTGAGGSIGSELCRQLCRYSPKRLVLLGRGENRIHWVYLHLKHAHPELEVLPCVANLTVATAMRELFEQYRPDVVFHAAAHKHVYLMEAAPVEAARNNILGTALLADLAEQYGTSRSVFISTDKAVDPTSVMGCTKRICELLLTHREAWRTDFVCVRFGNVLGSDGSVLEIFRRQLQRGTPLTVTHADATRYFMTIPEACFLVLQAGALGRQGDLFVLDMGEPVRIMDLARDFIMLSGRNGHAEDAIKIVGLAPGEKLHERLNHAAEAVERTVDPHILRIRNGSVPVDDIGIREHVESIRALVRDEDDEQVRQALLRITGEGAGAHVSCVAHSQPLSPAHETAI